MGRNQKLGEIMVSKGRLSEQQLALALEQQKKSQDSLLGLLLVKMGAVSPEDVARAIAEQAGVEYIDPTRVRVDPALVWRVPKEMAMERNLIPLTKLPGGRCQVAMADPRDINAIRDLEFLLRMTVVPVSASIAKIQEAIQRHYSMEHAAHQMLAGLDPIFSGPSLGQMGLELDGATITEHLKSGGLRGYIDLLNFLLANAIERRASDIHIEPGAQETRVRFRIDGMLREVLTLPTWAERPLVSRIKVVGQLDLSARKPQDGKVSATLGNRKLDLRIAVIPSQHGEKVVIRILDPQLLQTDLGELGWHPRALTAYYRLVSQPQGLVLCVGPTGSGKSTTLYATIRRLMSETTSIITVEDPIEYTLEGISQIQVNPKAGMTFDIIVRSLLRQDPNIIIIGEIRDAKTADVALEAANTGHLVLSTLHTNSASATITRLLDLKVPPYLLGASLNGIVAQRLVRKVCQQCSILGEPEQEDWDRLGIEPIAFKGEIRRAGPGCPACQYVGYIGRVGVIEVMTISDTLRQLIMDGASEMDLLLEARAEGLVPLFEDAIEKVERGVTTLEEVARVVPVDPWRGSRPMSSAMTAPLPRREERPSPPPPRPRSTQESPPPSRDPDAGREPRAETDEHSPAEITALSGDTPRILIADDAEEILRLVSLTLEDDNEIVTAHDGVEALEMARTTRPDLMILDVMMPRMSGFDVCEKLKDNPETADIPVLFLSARGERPHVKRGFHVGADDYLAKPFDPEELQLRVRALLRRSRAARANA